MKLCYPCLVLCLQDLSKASSVERANKAVKPVTERESAFAANNEQHMDEVADK